MIYLNEDSINEIGLNWNDTIEEIEKAVLAIADNDYAQPVKPYLRYRNPMNRIIAMPAFVGGKTNMAGIKWIASFPGNLEQNIPRANSVTILNNADTGEVESIINTALLSIIRTASVTGLLIKQYIKHRQSKKFNVGIIGLGPIGQYHFKMCNAILGERVEKYYLHDIRSDINLDRLSLNTVAEIEIVDQWQEVYKNADIFITCTVAKEPYIDKNPKPGALVLNISLRDFKDESYAHFKDCIIVDDWDEVCRESTTIENWHLKYKLQQEDVQTLTDIVKNECMKDYLNTDNIMFNPMGMAVFDVAIATYYYRKALKDGQGYSLK